MQESKLFNSVWVGLKSDGTDNGSGTNEGDVAFRDVKIEFFG